MLDPRDWKYEDRLRLLFAAVFGSIVIGLFGRTLMPRPFPAPWSVEEHPSCFIVSDDNRQALAHIYFEEDPGRR